MAFNSPPPIDPDRGKANLVVAEEHRRERVSGFRDVAIVLGWLRRAIRAITRPVRLLLNVLRRKNQREYDDELPRFD